MQTLPNLPAPVAREIYAALCGLLPPPVANSPEARASRDNAAMAAVAALHPANAFEAQLAAQIVGADAHAKDCLRLAKRPNLNPDQAGRNHAQAGSMLRHMQNGTRLLLRVQAVREKAEAAMQPAAMERAGYWFRDASVPAPEPAPAPVPQPEFAELTEAEQYALIYPQRAALIRTGRGLPACLDFGPPDAAIVEALVGGTSPILLALDRRRAGATATG